MKGAAPQRDVVDVFISYRRVDRERCVGIHEKLVGLRLKVWFDADIESGSSFDTAINDAVESARVVLVLWSPAAIQSQWVRGEADKGRERNVLCPVFVERTPLPVPFNQIQTLDLTQPEFADDNPEWLGVLRRIGVLVGRPGLEGYSRLLAGGDAANFDAWAARWPDDPLVDQSWASAVSEAAERNAARASRSARTKGRGLRKSAEWLLIASVLVGAMGTYLRFSVSNHAAETKEASDVANAKDAKQASDAEIQPVPSSPAADSSTPELAVSTPGMSILPPGSAASPTPAAGVQQHEAPTEQRHPKPPNVAAEKRPAPAAKPSRAQLERRGSEPRANAGPVLENGTAPGTRDGAFDCRTILRKFSLGEVITPEETAFLKSSCKSR